MLCSRNEKTILEARKISTRSCPLRIYYCTKLNTPILFENIHFWVIPTDLQTTVTTSNTFWKRISEHRKRLSTGMENTSFNVKLIDSI